MKAMGVAGGVNYTEKDFAKQLLQMSGGVDVIIDSAAGDGFSSFIDACNFGARIVFYGGTRGKINGLNPQLVFWKQLSILGSTMGSGMNFTEMLDFVNKYKITPIIDRVFTLKQVNEAFDRMKDYFDKI